jgi:hypothetical protein
MNGPTVVNSNPIPVSIENSKGPPFNRHPNPMQPSARAEVLVVSVSMTTKAHPNPDIDRLLCLPLMMV